MKEIIEEIVYELLRMDVDELEQFRESWTAELEKIHASEHARIICITLINVVLNHKEGGAAV